MFVGGGGGGGGGEVIGVTLWVTECIDGALVTMAVWAGGLFILDTEDSDEDLDADDTLDPIPEKCWVQTIMIKRDSIIFACTVYS